MKETFIIIGEGPTEYFFLTSLKDEFRTLQNIEPQYPVRNTLPEVLALEMVLLLAVHLRDDFQITFLPGCQQTLCVLIGTFRLADLFQYLAQ